MKSQTIRVPVELVIECKVGPNLASLTVEPTGMAWAKDARFPDRPAHSYSADADALQIAYSALRAIVSSGGDVLTLRNIAANAVDAVDREQAKR